MGGSGVSGEVIFPDYIESAHSEWLNGDGLDGVGVSLAQVMANALSEGGNPFGGSSYTDSETFFTDANSRLSTFNTKVGERNAQNDWDAYITKALTRVGSGQAIAPINPSSAESSATSLSSSEAVSIVSYALGQGVNPTVNFNAWIAAIRTALDDGAIPSTDVDSFVTAIRNYAQKNLTDVGVLYPSGISPLTTWGGYIDSALSKISSSTLLERLDVQTCGS